MPATSVVIAFIVMYRKIARYKPSRMKQKIEAATVTNADAISAMPGTLMLFLFLARTD